MSDIGEAFAAMKEESRKFKDNRKAEIVPLLEKACLEKGISCEKLTEYQWRLTSGNVKMDVYPNTKKYVLVGSNLKSQRFQDVDDLLKKMK